MKEASKEYDQGKKHMFTCHKSLIHIKKSREHIKRVLQISEEPYEYQKSPIKESLKENDLVRNHMFTCHMAPKKSPMNIKRTL